MFKKRDINITKSVLYFSIFLFAFLKFGDESFSLTDYQIKKICKKAKRELTCIKNLKVKRTYLQQGNKIEIPVLPFRR